MASTMTDAALKAELEARQLMYRKLSRKLHSITQVNSKPYESMRSALVEIEKLSMKMISLFEYINLESLNIPGFDNHDDDDDVNNDNDSYDQLGVGNSDSIGEVVTNYSHNNSICIDKDTFLLGISLGRSIVHTNPDVLYNTYITYNGNLDQVSLHCRTRYWNTFMQVLEPLRDWLTINELVLLDAACSDRIGRPMLLQWFKSDAKVYVDAKGQWDNLHYSRSKQLSYLQWLKNRQVLVSKIKFKPSELKEEDSLLREVLSRQKDTLQEIDLRYLLFTKEEFLSVVSLGYARVNTLNLGHLEITVDPSEVKVLSSYIPNLQHLTIEAYLSEDSIVAIAVNYPCIRSLDLSVKLISNIDINMDTCVNAFAANCRYLDTMIFNIHDHNKNLTDASIIYLANKCKCLTAIDLADAAGISDKSLIALSKNCTKLEFLSISNNQKCTDIGVKAIVEACHSSITDLCLESIRLTDVSVMSITRYCCNLEKINLPNCTQFSEQSICELLKKCTKLKELDISGCNQLTIVSLQCISTECKILEALIVNDFNALNDDLLESIVYNCNKLLQMECYENTNLSRDAVHNLQLAFPELDLCTDFDDEEDDYDEVGDDDDDDFDEGDEDFDDDNDDFDDGDFRYDDDEDGEDDEEDDDDDDDEDDDVRSINDLPNRFLEVD